VRDVRNAEKLYRRALALSKDTDIESLGNYAVFLDKVRGDVDCAHWYYLQAVHKAEERDEYVLTYWLTKYTIFRECYGLPSGIRFTVPAKIQHVVNKRMHKRKKKKLKREAIRINSEWEVQQNAGEKEDKEKKEEQEKEQKEDAGKKEKAKEETKKKAEEAVVEPPEPYKSPMELEMDAVEKQIQKIKESHKQKEKYEKERRRKIIEQEEETMKKEKTEGGIKPHSVPKKDSLAKQLQEELDEDKENDDEESKRELMAKTGLITFKDKRLMEKILNYLFERTLKEGQEMLDFRLVYEIQRRQEDLLRLQAPDSNILPRIEKMLSQEMGRSYFITVLSRHRAKVRKSISFPFFSNDVDKP
jgi:hypothetical protein